MKSIAATLVAAAFVAGPVYAACSYPKGPDRIPDGNTASMDEMLATKKQVDQYNKDMDAYLSCIKLEYDSTIAKDASTLSAEQKAELEKRQVQKHNAAVDELEATAARFNEQVKVYKAKTAK